MPTQDEEIRIIKPSRVDVGDGPRPPAPNEPQPQALEYVILLALMLLVAWTCWLLYAPQIRAMLQ